MAYISPYPNIYSSSNRRQQLYSWVLESGLLVLFIVHFAILLCLSCSSTDQRRLCWWDHSVLVSGLQMTSKQTVGYHIPAVPMLVNDTYLQHQNVCCSQPNGHLTNYLCMAFPSLPRSLWEFVDKNCVLNYRDISACFPNSLASRRYLTSGNIKSAVFLHLYCSYFLYM